MTSCFSTQLDTLSSALCSNIEIGSSEEHPCSSIRQWRQNRFTPSENIAYITLQNVPLLVAEFHVYK